MSPACLLLGPRPHRGAATVVQELFVMLTMKSNDPDTLRIPLLTPLIKNYIPPSNLRLGPDEPCLLRSRPQFPPGLCFVVTSLAARLRAPCGECLSRSIRVSSAPAIGYKAIPGPAGATLPGITNTRIINPSRHHLPLMVWVLTSRAVWFGWCRVSLTVCSLCDLCLIPLDLRLMAYLIPLLLCFCHSVEQ